MQVKNDVIQKIYKPVVCFRVPGNVAQRAALLRYTHLAWYNVAYEYTQIVVLVDREWMQTDIERKYICETLRVWYEQNKFSDLSNFYYYQTGLSIALKDTPEILNSPTIKHKIL